MTQTQKNVIKVLLPFVGTIFALGVAWNDLKGDVQRSTPLTRFEAESIRTDATFRAYLEANRLTQDALRDISARLMEICLAVRSGCR